jgi:hypothetical protein
MVIGPGLCGARLPHNEHGSCQTSALSHVLLKTFSRKTPFCTVQTQKAYDGTKMTQFNVEDASKHHPYAGKEIFLGNAIE